MQAHIRREFPYGSDLEMEFVNISFLSIAIVINGC